MTIHETGFAAIDFEGAGARPGASDAPVQVGIAVMRGCVLDESAGFSSYIASPIPVTWSARKVHGISDEALRGAPELPGLWPEIRDRLAGRWVVAHGAATEKRFLRAFPFHGFGPWVDTLKLARAVEPTLTSHALSDVAAHFGVVATLRERIPDFRWHDAYCDAVASIEILRAIIRRFSLDQEPPEVLLHADDGPFYRSRARRPGRG